jgi:hypothetical protein
MEISQGNSLCSYQQTKMSFFFYKIDDQEGKTSLHRVIGTSV